MNPMFSAQNVSSGFTEIPGTRQALMESVEKNYTLIKMAIDTQGKGAAKSEIKGSSKKQAGNL